MDETNTVLDPGVVVDIDGTEYTTGAGGVISHAINGAAYTTLHDLIDAINALPGFIAKIGDALTTHDTGTDDFIDVAETVVTDANIRMLKTLFRDISEDNIAYVRIGLPQKQDMAPIQLMQIRGLITNATGATGEIIKDNMVDYKSDGSHQVVYEAFTPDTSLTNHLDDNVLEAQDVQGSIVLKVYATSATGAAYSVKYRQSLGV